MLSCGSRCPAAQIALALLSLVRRTWESTGWEKPGQQERKTWLPLLWCWSVLGTQTRGNDSFSASGTPCLRLAEAFLSGWSQFFSAEKGTGTASSLTDALPHTGMDSLNSTQSLSRSSLFLPIGDGAFGFSLLSHHHSLAVCRSTEPVLLQHQALLRQWPFPTRPEGLGGGCRRWEVTPHCSGACAQYYDMSGGKPRRRCTSRESCHWHICRCLSLFLQRQWPTGPDSSGDPWDTCLGDIWRPMRGVLNRNVSFATAASKLLFKILPVPWFWGQRDGRRVPEPLTSRDWAEIPEFQPLSRLGADEGRG